MSKRATRACTCNTISQIASCKRSQVTIFIILAIIIVGGIIGYFALRERLFIEKLPAKFQPIETFFLDCVKEKALEGKEIMMDKAGYIYLGNFEPGSEYRPFSNQLDFYGTGVPYWYYVSGNNILSEQLPGKQEMQQELERYLEENLACDFSSFEAQGYIIDIGEMKADVKINQLNVDISVNSELVVEKEDEIARQTLHETKIETKLGKFYDTALKIYNYEKQKAFIEDYAIDVLRNYAPVDGVELSCAPKIWMKQDIDNELKAALEANMQAIKLKGNYYQANDKDDRYFIQDLEVEDAVNFIYSRDWPTRIEVWQSKGGIMLAEPVGASQGLGVIGFCYVPYHFVYDINYPVLIQVYDANEIFQFPVAIIIEKNKQREALPATAIVDSEPELCRYRVQEVSVYTYNTRLEPVEADIRFECLRETCDIGKTKKDEESNAAVLTEKFPQCGNAFIIAEAQGYSPKYYLFSTNQQGIIDILLDKLYNVSVSLKVDGKETDDRAIINFNSADNLRTIVWPEQKNIELSEGSYNISVYVYRNSTITIPAVNREQCSEVPKSGLAGIFGMTEEKCFNVNIPSQRIENALAGGGKTSDYLIEPELEKGKLEINVMSLPIPTSLEQLQDAYNLLEINPVYLEFKE